MIVSDLIPFVLLALAGVLWYWKNGHLLYGLVREHGEYGFWAWLSMAILGFAIGTDLSFMWWGWK